MGSRTRGASDDDSHVRAVVVVVKSLEKGRLKPNSRVRSISYEPLSHTHLNSDNASGSSLQPDCFWQVITESAALARAASPHHNARVKLHIIGTREIRTAKPIPRTEQACQVLRFFLWFCPLRSKKYL